MSDSILDLEALLAPLEAGDGAGQDPRADEGANAPYQKLRDARSEARAEERELDSRPGEDNPPPQQWRDVLRFGTECLVKRGKDFEVAAFMTEALVRQQGLAGLIAGTRLLNGLLDQYWEIGFPQPEDDLPADERMEGRSAPIGGLSGEGVDGTIMQALRRITLFHEPDGKAVSLYLWMQAEETAGIAEEPRRKARYAKGVPTMEAANTAAHADAAYMKGVGLGALRAAAVWVELGTRLDQRFGANAPSTRRVTEVLAKIQSVVVAIHGPLVDPNAVAAETEAAGEEAGDMAAEAGGGGGKRAIKTRDDVIRLIEEAADWFLKTEPHSPMAFTLTDAVRRARMPLPELLAEVLPDAAARKAMLTMLGIRQPEG